MKNRMTVFVVVAMMAAFSLAATDTTTVDPAEATTVEGAFPNGLPKGAVAIDEDNVTVRATEC